MVECNNIVDLINDIDFLLEENEPKKEQYFWGDGEYAIDYISREIKAILDKYRKIW